MMVDHVGRMEGLAERLNAALVDLERSPSYLMLVDAAEGTETRRRYACPRDDIADCWSMMALARARLDELRRVIERDDLEPSDPALGRAVNERNLSFTASAGSRSADPSPKAYSLSTLLDDVRKRIDTVQEGVDAVDRRWQSVLPRVTAAQETVRRLRTELDSLGITEPLVSMADRKADELAERLVADPLRVEVADGAELDLLVADAADQMARLRVGRDNLDADLGSTEAILANLRVLRSRAETRAGEARAKVATSSQVDDEHRLAAVPGPGVIDGDGGLAQQLDRLFADAAGRNWTEKRARLDRWLDTARRLAAQLERADEINRRPLEVRDELRGRLAAYRAKMAATGKAEDMNVVGLVDRAEALLYVAPADVEQAADILAELADRLRS